MKPPKRPQHSSNKSGKGFVPLEQFQLTHGGVVPTQFGQNSLFVGKKKEIIHEQPVRKRALLFNDLGRVTQIAHPVLTGALRSHKILATRASVIQDLLNHEISADSNGFRTTIQELLLARQE
jgi:hypothetical protein